MFKKAVKIGAQNQLSGKDRKTVKTKLSSHFKGECVEAVLSKYDKITCNKASGGSKMLIYTADNTPLFVDGTGKGDFFPSLYIVSAYQPILPTLLLNQGVEAYIFNGANLMWPGVHAFPPEFHKDQVVSVMNSEGQFVAIGAMGCSKADLDKSDDKSGIAVYVLHYRGDKLWEMGPKAPLDVVMSIQPIKKEEAEPEKEEKPKEASQTKKEAVKQQKDSDEQQQKKEVAKQQSEEQSDDDFDFGGLVHKKQQQNKPQIKMEKKNYITEQQDGRGKKKAAGKKPPPKKAQKEESEEEEQEEVVKAPPAKGKKKNQGKKKVVEEESEEEEVKPIKGRKVEESDDDEPHGRHKAKGGRKKKGGKGKKKDLSDEEEVKPQQKREQGEQAEDQGAKSAISPQMMDAHFKEALLNVLKLVKIDAELPIDSGRLYSDFISWAASEGVTLNIKDSTYKKLGKFYEDMSKQKIIEFKAAKEKKGQQGSTVTKVFWQSDEVKNHFPTIRQLRQKDTGDEGHQQDYGKYHLQLSKTIKVEYVYKLTAELAQVLTPKKVNYMPDSDEQKEMEKQKQEQEAYYPQKELTELIQKYLNQVAVKQGKEAKQGKEGKERKTDKMITLNYKEDGFLLKLLKKEVEEYEQNMEKEQEGEDDSDEEETNKKKNKKNKKDRMKYLRIERGLIINKITKLAKTYYQLTDPQTGLNKFKEGTFKGVTVTADKVTNKNVTKVSGLEQLAPSTTSPEEMVKQIHGFAQQLQVKFACSATVQNLPGKNAGREIQLQGNFLEEVQSLLMQDYGVSKDFIATVNKLGGRKKK